MLVHLHMLRESTLVAKCIYMEKKILHIIHRTQQFEKNGEEISLQTIFFKRGERIFCNVYDYRERKKQEKKGKGGLKGDWQTDHRK